MKNQILYFQKNTDSQKYLAIETIGKTHKVYYTDKIWMAHLSTLKPKELTSHEVGTITLDELQKIYSPIVSEILVIGDLLHMKYKNYNDMMPVIPGDHKHIRNAVKNAKEKLSTFHKQIDNILADPRSHENDLYETQGSYDELIHHISNIASLNDIQEINNIFKAYNKDSKSINGIAKKING